MAGQPRGDLRICASCFRLFRRSQHENGCPFCQFAHYGARWAVGPSAYREESRQSEWRERLSDRFLRRVEEMLKDGGELPVVDREFCGSLQDFLQGRNRLPSLKEQAKLLREALLEIAAVSANENSEPDRMADALGEIQGIVHRALEATKEGA